MNLKKPAQAHILPTGTSAAVDRVAASPKSRHWSRRAAVATLLGMGLLLLPAGTAAADAAEWWDVDGDGYIDASATDINGNGVLDRNAVDTNADGYADIWLSDGDEDGLVDYAWLDTNMDSIGDFCGLSDGYGNVDFTRPCPWAHRYDSSWPSATIGQGLSSLSNSLYF